MRTYESDAADCSWQGYATQSAYSGRQASTYRITDYRSDGSASVIVMDTESPSFQEFAASRKRLRLVLVGDDHDLLETRALVLNSVGYDATPLSSRAALELSPFSRFDGLIICHSLSEARACVLAILMRDAKPQAPIVRLSYLPCTKADSFTSVCGSMHTPVEFVADMHAVFRYRMPHARDLVDPPAID